MFAQVPTVAFGRIRLAVALEAFPQHHVEAFRIQFVFSTEIEVLGFLGPVSSMSARAATTGSCVTIK
ncbi:MAG TPA: hypothetical protein VN872_11085, partial [Candidatus Acidoferrum sp.]|nr:hypothetical protein [Candidatus Acidoferrum sp.]